MSDRIYVLSNRSMPGIVKIGWTSRAVVERVAELSSHTGVPTEFTLVREFIVDDGLQTERVIHEHLANHRLAGNREFFQMEADEAGLAIEAILRVEHSLSRRDFGREEELLKRALPLVRNLRFIRPQLLEERMGIEYETALLVIALLKARGALNERGEVSVSWRAFGQDVPNRIESEPRRQESEEPARHREIRQLVQKAIGGLCDEQTGEQVEVQFDFSVEPPALVIKASPAVVAEAQVRLESVVWPSQPPPPLPPSATRTADQHVSSVPRSKRPKPLSAAQPTVIQNYVLPPLDLLRLPDTRIHIHAPVPGKDCVGIEAPSNAKAEILMHDLLESNEWRDTKAQIPIALGSDLKGRAIIQDLAKMPHLLIAGSTGSGKSVLLHSLILSLLYRFGPDQLCFVMIDPRLVELQHYNVLPHLVVPVVTDPKKVPLALSWVVNEMEKRYQLFALVGMPDIKSFNDRPKGKGLPSDELESLPMVRKEKVEAGADGFAVEVDEQNVGPRRGHLDNLGDFNLIAPTDIEMALGRTAQMGHAAGIHLFLASQYPDKTV